MAVVDGTAQVLLDVMEEVGATGRVERSEVVDGSCRWKPGRLLVSTRNESDNEKSQ